MKDLQLELSQLFDTVEERLESIASAFSQESVTAPVSKIELLNVGSARLDDAILRLVTVLRKARNLKNTLSPINQFPPEILAHIASFLPAGFDLINATAVCQHWRIVLLSFPRLWCNPSGSPSTVQAYIQRSKSTPINVTLPSLQSAELIVPHVSRLVDLTVQSGRFSQLMIHLPHPIPTLHSLRIESLLSIGEELISPLSCPPNPFYFYVKTLETVGISVFRGGITFPHVTELTVHMSFPWKIEGLLSILRRLPVLERLYVTFHGKLSVDSSPNVVTLPHVQEVKLSPFADAREPVQALPIRSFFMETLPTQTLPMQALPILEYLHLPNLKSLSLRVPPEFALSCPLFPITFFGERLPALGELPELRVKLGTSIGEATFRSPSQATLEYITGPFTDYFRYECRAWRYFPLDSVRTLIVDVVSPPSDKQIEWLVELWECLRFLEGLEFTGDCGHALGRLRDTYDTISLPIQTITVRHCGEHERIQALGLKRAIDDTGFDVDLVYIPDSGAQEVTGADEDVDGLGGE